MCVLVHLTNGKRLTNCLPKPNTLPHLGQRDSKGRMGIRADTSIPTRGPLPGDTDEETIFSVRHGKRRKLVLLVDGEIRTCQPKKKHGMCVHDAVGLRVIRGYSSVWSLVKGSSISSPYQVLPTLYKYILH